MEILKRYDLNDLKLGKNVKVTPQGFLVIPAFTARTGIQEYRMADGSVLKEYRPDVEVFSDSSMSSLRTAAVTDGHPKDDVGPDNAHELMLGHTDGVIEKVQDGDEWFLKTNLAITHKKAIDAIRAGKAQLSNGYTVELDFEPGEYRGKKYDAIQKNIVNNHIAIVWNARAGEKASLRLDEKEGILLPLNTKPNEGNKQMKIKLGDKEFEVNDELGAAFKEEMKKMKGEKKDSTDKVVELEKDLNASKDSETKLSAKIDSLESDLAKEKESKLDESTIKEMVKETIAVRETATKILDSETIEKLGEMEISEIKKAVIKADSSNVDEAKLENQAYVDARFDHICENISDSSESVKKLGKDHIDEKGGEEKEVYISPEQKRADNMVKEQEESRK